MQEIYGRSVEVPIRISKGASEDAALKKLERWPREAALSIVLDESGGNFKNMVEFTAHDYGLTLGEKKWDVDSSGDEVKARMTWDLLRDGEVKGRALLTVEIPKRPQAEESGSNVYVARVTYKIELDEEILQSSTTAGIVEFNL